MNKDEGSRKTLYHLEMPLSSQVFLKNVGGSRVECGG